MQVEISKANKCTVTSRTVLTTNKIIKPTGSYKTFSDIVVSEDLNTGHKINNSQIIFQITIQITDNMLFQCLFKVDAKTTRA